MTPAGTPVLEIADLKTWFRVRGGLAKAVDGVSFSVAPGECYAVVGESGCGKSVTALSVMGLVPQPAGFVAVLQATLSNSSPGIPGALSSDPDAPVFLDRSRISLPTASEVLAGPAPASTVRDGMRTAIDAAGMVMLRGTPHTPRTGLV